MSLSRRALLSALALAAPAPAFAQWPFGLGRRGGRRPREGRADYAGSPLRQQLGNWQFDIAKAAASTRLQPVIRDGYEARLNEAIGKMPGVRAITAAVAEPDGSVWTQAWRADPGPLPTRFHWASVGKAYTATAIMQMVEAGQLALTDTLERWAPAMPNAAWITLEVHSSLAAVGLTAAFAGALAQANISCNVIAGYYHDHLFVARDDAERALSTLRALAASAGEA